MRFSLLKTVFSGGIFLLNFTKIQLPVSVYEKLPPLFSNLRKQGGFHKGRVFHRNACDNVCNRKLNYYFQIFILRFERLLGGGLRRFSSMGVCRLNGVRKE